MQLTRRVRSEFSVWNYWFRFNCPGELGDVLRSRYVRKYAARAGNELGVGHGSWLRGLENVQFGEDVWLGRGSVFEAREGTILIGSGTRFNEQVFLGADFGSIEIGADVIVGMNVVARASDHRFDRTPEILIRLQGHNAGSIVVGDDVWIGANVTLLPGTKIGDHSVIGAGAVVNGEIPALSLAVGAPARVIKKLGEDVEAARGEFKGAQPRDSGGATDEQS